ncbi:MAG: lysoplasmalogenase [Rhizobiaceae bacterium]|nr:lysoplasmalogenase [Rhizobiaceae bacterium]
MMPFAGGLESTANGALILSAGAGLLYLFVVEAQPSIRRTLIKTCAVALLALLAFIEGAHWLLVVALAFSAVGDALLSHDGDEAFVGGLASFLVAHVAYIALFLSHGNGLIGPIQSSALLSIMALVIVLTTAATLNILLRRVPPALRLPVLAYGLAIGVMGLAALTTGHIWVIIGAVLFMLSDTVLGFERFVMSTLGPGRWAARHAVWVLYYAAQLIITLAALLG